MTVRERVEDVAKRLEAMTDYEELGDEAAALLREIVGPVLRRYGARRSWASERRIAPFNPNRDGGPCRRYGPRRSNLDRRAT